MTKNKKILAELEKRIERLEHLFLEREMTAGKDSENQASYGEVLDEWLNGKKC